MTFACLLTLGMLIKTQWNGCKDRTLRSSWINASFLLVLLLVYFDSGVPPASTSPLFLDFRGHPESAYERSFQIWGDEEGEVVGWDTKRRKRGRWTTWRKIGKRARWHISWHDMYSKVYIYLHACTHASKHTHTHTCMNVMTDKHCLPRSRKCFDSI